jgi:hypothetical protein
VSEDRGASRRPTKAERKEQARLEREALERKAERRKRMRLVGGALVVLGIVAAVALVVLLQPESSDLPDEAELLSQADAAAERAECTPIENVGPYQPESNDGAHIGTETGPVEMPPLDTYPSTPPASGPHAQVTQGSGLYDSPPPLDQVIHSLEHGAVVIWYDPALDGPELQRIKDFYADQDHVLVAPYDYSDQGAAGQLPPGVGMSIVAWHFQQECADPSLPVAAAFVDTHRGFGDLEGYEGEAPEAGAAI